MMILCLVLSCVLIGQSELKKKANALNGAGLASATVIGNGDDLWDATKSEINISVANELERYIFGNNDPDSYIDTKGVDYFGSKVLQSKTINASISNDNGLVVTLGGLKWMVASVTKDTTSDKNIVATLYLADTTITQAWGANTNAVGYNAYSTSNVRYALVKDSATASTWGLFRDDTTKDDDFAQQYLVQPKYISYQNNENLAKFGMTTDNTVRYTLGNEALTANPEGASWYSSTANTNGNYSQGGSWSFYNWASVGAQAYDAWGDDYIWLPSLSEVGCSNYTPVASSGYTDYIWGLHNNQRMATPSYFWLRSGRYYSYNASYVVAANGMYQGDFGLNDGSGLRPAIHLNLSAIGFGVSLPEDIEI
ncbi:MAG: hypothetical protein K2G37_01980, partial [Clostridia bacterium]|nr:hypothetical protein [Clostridia bacterium]